MLNEKHLRDPFDRHISVPYKYRTSSLAAWYDILKPFRHIIADF